MTNTQRIGHSHPQLVRIVNGRTFQISVVAFTAIGLVSLTGAGVLSGIGTTSSALTPGLVVAGGVSLPVAGVGVVARRQVSRFEEEIHVFEDPPPPPTAAVRTEGDYDMVIFPLDQHLEQVCAPNPRTQAGTRRATLAPIESGDPYYANYVELEGMRSIVAALPIPSDHRLVAKHFYQMVATANASFILSTEDLHNPKFQLVLDDDERPENVGTPAKFSDHGGVLDPTVRCLEGRSVFFDGSQQIADFHIDIRRVDLHAHTVYTFFPRYSEGAPSLDSAFWSLCHLLEFAKQEGIEIDGHHPLIACCADGVGSSTGIPLLLSFIQKWKGSSPDTFVKDDLWDQWWELAEQIEKQVAPSAGKAWLNDQLQEIAATATVSAAAAATGSDKVIFAEKVRQICRQVIAARAFSFLDPDALQLGKVVHASGGAAAGAAKTSVTPNAPRWKGETVKASTREVQRVKVLPGYFDTLRTISAVQEVQRCFEELVKASIVKEEDRTDLDAFITMHADVSLENVGYGGLTGPADPYRELYPSDGSSVRVHEVLEVFYHNLLLYIYPTRLEIAQAAEETKVPSLYSYFNTLQTISKVRELTLYLDALERAGKVENRADLEAFIDLHAPTRHENPNFSKPTLPPLLPYCDLYPYSGSSMTPREALEEFYQHLLRYISPELFEEIPVDLGVLRVAYHEFSIDRLRTFSDLDVKYHPAIRRVIKRDNALEYLDGLAEIVRTTTRTTDDRKKAHGTLTAHLTELVVEFCDDKPLSLFFQPNG